jgi:hypothetical protein
VRLDESIAYYWTSVGVSALAVFLFLRLLRRPASGQGSPGAVEPRSDGVRAEGFDGREEVSAEPSRSPLPVPERPPEA